MAAISFERDPTKDLVSVVIPTYRGERFIGEALASVGRQTYPYWEVVVVEDGSCDGAENIVQDFARRHETHRVDFSRSPRNHGCGYTRNLTFAKAGGEFIAILDADDRWLPEYLAASVEALHVSGKDVAYSSSVMIDDHTERLLGIWGPNAEDLADFPQSLFGRSFLTPSATVLRRQVLADVGLWAADLRYCDDFCYWMRCIAAGKQFQHVGGCNCLYRKNHELATTQRLCATLEQFAEVAERFMTMPALRPETCRHYASNSYLLAAQFHATADSRRDPSADPSRTPRLLLKAWQLWPKRVDCLLKAVWLAGAEPLRRRRHQRRLARLERKERKHEIRAAA